MKSILFLITIISSMAFAEAPDHFARKETVTTSVLGQKSYTRHLDITLTGQIRLNVYETGKPKLLDTKLYGTLDPRIMGKLRAAVQGLSLENDNAYSYEAMAVSGHESAISYLVLSRMGYILVQTQGGPVRVHPQAKTLSSAPLAIRDLLDAYDVLTETRTYENPNIGTHCVSKNFDGSQAYVSGYIKNGVTNNYVLQSPGCAAIRVVTAPGYKLEQYTLAETVEVPFDKVKGSGYGLSLDGKFSEQDGVFFADRAIVTERVD